MAHRISTAGAAALLAIAAPLVAQAKKPTKTPVQQVIPPKTVYWINAATSGGFGLSGKAPSTGDMMRMMMGSGAGAPSKTLTLDLGSKLPANGTPLAAHAIPPGMAMGASLALKGPRPAAPGKPAERGRDPDEFERPKGKLLLFWGCGEKARPGQPIIIDFAKLAEGQIPPNLFAGERVRIVSPPSATSWPSYGGWPNDDKPSKQGVPAKASLLGAHQITGNYPPVMDFTLTQDWMPGLELAQAKAPSGALALSWNAIPGATAHFAQMMGGGQDAGQPDAGPTIVFWSSSETQTFLSGLSDFIAPAEAARLVGRKQLLPASQTSCAVPAEAMAAAQGALLTLVAHGPEQNIIHPPRPADPRAPWVQEWAVKARFASRTGALAGMAMGGSAGKSKGSKPKCAPDPGSAIGSALGGALGGFLGSKKKSADCE